MKKTFILFLFSTLILLCSSTWPSIDKHKGKNARRQIQTYHDLAARNAQFMNNMNNNFLMGCNCIKLKHCNPIVESVRNNYGSYFSSFLNSLQIYQCKYQKDEMYVCCPNNMFGSNQFQPHTNQHYNHHHNNYYQNNWHKYINKMWNNWNSNGYQERESAEEQDQEEEVQSYHGYENDKKSNAFFIQPHFMPQYISYPITTLHPHSYPFTNNQNNPYNFIANHEDARTHKNCPSQISQEFTLPPDHKFFQEQHTETTTTTTTTASPVPWLSENLQAKTSLINHQECGKSSSSRIIGGEDVGEGRFPWVGRLSYRNKSNGKISHRCAGSLISHKYILTAGHCVSNLIDTLELVLVRFGDERNQEEGCSQNGSCMKEEDFEIEKVIVHPSYNKPRFQNDVALIRLTQSTETSSNSLVPICLPILNYERFSTDVQTGSGIVAGYGATSRTSNAQSSLMKWIRLPFVETATCASFYANYSQTLGTRILISNFQLCMQGRQEMDACQGDSGGPLMSDVENERYVLLGLISFGPRQCGLANFPGVYTKVSSYLEWILQNIEE